MRAAYSSISHEKGVATYVNAPLSEAPYTAGALSAEILREAVDTANFMRWLAGLEPLSPDEELNSLAQHGAVLMAANKSLSHDPAQPEDMEDAFFDAGYRAAASSNLIAFNWNEEGLLSEAVIQFARDEGEHNRSALGHRRWLLYPGMRYTGFGFAQDTDGRSYAAMYVMDNSNEGAAYDLIRWPSAGAFPAEYMGPETIWSVSPNPDVYDLNASLPRIELREETSGSVYSFNIMEGTAGEGGYCALGGGRYGDGPAYLFQPELSVYADLADGYQQNQVWTVRLSGMVLADGTPAGDLGYTVELASLTPIDPSAVEISPREATMAVGESLTLTGVVIPGWADDLSVVWRSEDEAVATVGADGTVQAVGAGTCAVIAETVNGRSDRVQITVTE